MESVTIKDLYECRYEPDKLVILIERMYKQSKEQLEREQSWISVEDEKPKGDVLVYLEANMVGRRIHGANYHPNITEVGGQFDFDAPKVTHWMPLPPSPLNTL